jgi:uncharacterized membrane protein YqiK
VPTNEEILQKAVVRIADTLQRIADALEAIAKKSDPEFKPGSIKR